MMLVLLICDAVKAVTRAENCGGTALEEVVRALESP